MEHPDQARLRAYLDEAADKTEPMIVHGSPWALRLDVGLPVEADLHRAADLDNYALPLATRLATADMVSVWCGKQHAESSRITVASALPVASPEAVVTARTTASVESEAFKEQVRAAVAERPLLPTGGVHLQISFVVGPGRNWLNLWKPTIDALDPLLGRTRPDREWHPLDGRVVELGLHVSIDSAAGHEVEIGIAAAPEGSGSP